MRPAFTGFRFSFGVAMTIILIATLACGGAEEGAAPEAPKAAADAAMVTKKMV